jgi:hypothetical protein
MKTTTLILFLFLFFKPILNSSGSWQKSNEVFTGIYNGLTEDMEFQFTANNRQVYLFNEIAENLDYDLYDEVNFGKKFKVTWQKHVIEILDDEDEPTGENEEIRIIMGLQKL